MGAPLNIDWQQILLHVFNFIILAGGLWLLLYKPVKDFMTKREKYYKDIDDSANEKAEKAKESERLYEERIAGAEKEIGEMKANAYKEAEKAAKACLEDAEDQKRKIIEDARTFAESEKKKIMQEANEEIEGLVAEAIDKMMASAEENPVDDFLSSAGKE